MQKKKVFSLLLKIAIALVVVLFILGFAISRYITQFFTEERIVHLIEEQIDARVSLTSYSISVFPTKLDIKGFALSERDEAANTQQALTERSDPKNTVFSTEHFQIKAKLGRLFKGEIEVSKILIKSPTLDIILYEDGTNSLESILLPPTATQAQAKDKESSAPSPTSVTPSVKEQVATQTPAQSSTSAPAPEFLAKLGELKLEQAVVTLFLDAPKIRVELEPFDLTLKEIAVNPNALASMNEAKLDLKGKLSIDNPENADSVWAHLDFNGPASVSLFDDKTGEISPNVTTAIELADSSFLSNDLPFLNNAWKKVKSLELLGLNQLNIPEKATFSQSQKIAINLNDNVMTVIQPLGVSYGSWEIAIHSDSKLDMASNTHHLSFDLIANTETTQFALDQITKISSNINHLETTNRLNDTIKELLLNENDLLKLTFHSSGPLEQPNVTMDTQLPNIKALIKQETKSTIKNFINDKIDKEVGEDHKDSVNGLLKKLF